MRFDQNKKKTENEDKKKSQIPSKVWPGEQYAG